jgi:hypothetical protein
MSNNRSDLYRQRPRTTPPGHVSGLSEAVDEVRRIRRSTEPIRDALGNFVEQPLVDLPTALATLQKESPSLYRALDDECSQYDDPLGAAAILTGDPLADSDVDTVGTLDGIPLYK